MAITTFNDHADYHPALISAALAAENDPRFRGEMFRGACGTKVRKIPGWNAAAAALIHGRALMLAHHTLSRKPVYADDSWGSIYHTGDYCMPHSHLRSNASIVYMLDPGDDDPGEPMAGKLCFADARIPVCCPHEPGRVTQHLIPTMDPGHDDHFRQRLPAQRQSLPRAAPADHAVVEYHHRAAARPTGGGLGQIAAIQPGTLKVRVLV